MARRGRRRHHRDTGPARARAVLDRAVQKKLGRSQRVEVDPLRRLGRGLSRHGYRFDLQLEPSGADDAWIVLLPCHDAPPEYDRRARQEAKVLERLADEDLALRVPRLIALDESEDRPALVVTAIFGVPLDLRVGRPLARPWEVVADVAVQVHSVGPGSELGGCSTCREYALEHLEPFAGLTEPLVRDAHAWVLENLPPEEPTGLIHGDLLGQNIFLNPRDAEQGGDEIPEREVRFYEVCFAVRWYRESLGPQGTHPPEEYLRRLRSVLRLAEKSSRAG